MERWLAVPAGRHARKEGDTLANDDLVRWLEDRGLEVWPSPFQVDMIDFGNIAKTVDFARNGADGIANAICFNCMVGNASAAIIEKIRRDHDDIPIITAVYSGNDDPSRQLVLEAFVAEVTARAARRVALTAV